MCTLLLGFGIPGPGSIVLAANRDEDPGRASARPGVLLDRPRVVGGRDLLKGGTWLAIREGRALVAVLNRRGTPEDEADAAMPRRSRGLLALDVAAAGEGDAAPALAAALDAVRGGSYAPFSMLFASPEGCWLLAHDGVDSTEARRVTPGWHAITHADLDDPDEPRTAWLARKLSGLAPATPEEAERGLLRLLGEHGDRARVPAVCIHEGRMVTVSSSFVCLGPHGPRYRHLEGRPCRTAAADCTPLLRGVAAPAEPA
jgi:uncharacterized protein with NRDE domain